jgi:hypothetical protein
MNYTHIVKQPNLKLKTRPKQLLGYLPLAFELPSTYDCKIGLFGERRRVCLHRWADTEQANKEIL